MQLAVITGANKGIGFETSVKLCRSGYKVIMACRDSVRGLEAEAQLKGEGFDVEFRELNVCDKNNILLFVEGMQKDYAHIDILVNNAAVYLESKPIPMGKKAKETIEINFFGTLWVTEALIPLLRKSALPRIVNVSSELGRLSIIKSEEIRNLLSSSNLTTESLSELIMGYLDSALQGTHSRNGWGCSPYSASKVGVIAYTKILARNEPTIIVNCCSPGYCSTDMSDGKGDKTPEEGARTVYMVALVDDINCRGKFFADEREIPCLIAGFITPKSEFLLEIDGNGIAITREEGCVIAQTRGVDIGGKLFCWGEINSEREITNPPEDINFVQIIAGFTFKCGIAVDQTVHCWGTMSGTVPGLYTQISSDSDSRFACGIQIDGKINCWGRKHVSFVVPQISGRFTQISCSEGHCCALDESGYPHCWGNIVEYPMITWKEFKESVDNFGWSEEEIVPGDDDYADDDNTAPIVSDDDKRLSKIQFRQISATRDMTCGITLIGAHLRCWGYKMLHRRGRWPLSVKGPYRQVSAGVFGVCAIVGSEEDLDGEENFLKVASPGDRSPDSLECWGMARDYFNTTRYTAWDQVSVGSLFACGVSMDSQLYCDGMLTPQEKYMLNNIIMA